MAPPKMAEHTCELCGGDASLYCPSDSAFLCSTCDSTVHRANFLVARHVRSSLCLHFSFSGPGVLPPSTFLCRVCSPHSLPSSSSSSSSSCVSSSSPPPPTMPPPAVEGVLVSWGRRVGGLGDADVRRVVHTAVQLIDGCVEKMTGLPCRVFLATAFWVALRVCRRRPRGGAAQPYACQDLKRVEQISGVPGKLIVAMESRLARAVKRRQSREDHEEGWAEC